MHSIHSYASYQKPIHLNVRSHSRQRLRVAQHIGCTACLNCRPCLARRLYCTCLDHCLQVLTACVSDSAMHHCTRSCLHALSQATSVCLCCNSCNEGNQTASTRSSQHATAAPDVAAEVHALPSIHHQDLWHAAHQALCAAAHPQPLALLLHAPPLPPPPSVV